MTVGTRNISDEWAAHQSLVFPPFSDTPYVAFREGGSYGNTTVKKYNGNQWRTIGTDSFSDGDDDYQSLAFPPSSDTPYVAYSDNYNLIGTTVKKFDGNQWGTVGTEGLSDNDTWHQSLAFPPSSDTPYVANGYGDWITGFGTAVKKFNDSQWVMVGTDTFSDGALFHSLAFSPSSGTPYVAYQDGFDGNTTVNKFDCLPLSSSFNDSTDALTAHFTNQSSNADSVKWYFGDDSTTTQQNPSHTYQSPGTYQVCMEITNVCGETDSTCQKVKVCTTPFASFTASTDTLTANFTDQSSNSDSLIWHFGDGNTSPQPNPSHTYQSGGTYKVCLEVTNACGKTDSSCQNVTVESTGVPSQRQSRANIALHPNPTSHTVTFQYTLSRSSNVKLKIHTVQGKVYQTVTNDRKSRGNHHNK